MAKYRQVEKRVNELELEFNSDIIDLGKKHLLFEYLELQEELCRRDRIRGRLIDILCLFAYFALGFAVCFQVFIGVLDYLFTSQIFR